jgi:hypothetical protein
MFYKKIFSDKFNLFWTIYSGLFSFYYPFIILSQSGRKKKKFNKIGTWSKFHTWTRLDLGYYSIFAREVRSKVKDTLQKNMYNPINQLLALNSLPLIEEFIDKKMDYPVTIYGKECSSPCIKQSTNYYWAQCYKTFSVRNLLIFVIS